MDVGRPMPNDLPKPVTYQNQMNTISTTTGSNYGYRTCCASKPKIGSMENPLQKDIGNNQRNNQRNNLNNEEKRYQRIQNL